MEINILREIGEELFGFQELEDATSQSHFDAEWFLRLSPLTELCGGLAAGDTSLWYLSSGFDAFNGTFEIHVAIDMSKPSYRKLLDQAVGNWEIARSNNNTQLNFKPLDWRDFLDWHLSGLLSNGSAVAISQVRRLMDHNSNGAANASLLPTHKGFGE